MPTPACTTVYQQALLTAHGTVRHHLSLSLSVCVCVCSACHICLSVSLLVKVQLTLKTRPGGTGMIRELTIGLATLPSRYPGAFSGQRQGWKAPRGPSGSALLLCVLWSCILVRYPLELHFYCATLCISAVFAVIRCLSVRHVGVLYPQGSRYRQTSFSAQ